MQKRQLLLFFLAFLFLNAADCFAQGPSWVWATGISQAGNHSLYTSGIDTDAAGNIYATGFTATGAVIDGTTLQRGNMFLVKYDPQGNIVWMQHSYSDMMPSSLQTDDLGNSYITGIFSNILNIGSYSIPSQGRNDIFTIKYDSSGNLLWASVGGSLGPPQGYPQPAPYFEDQTSALAIDEVGNCYIGGTVMTSPSLPAIFDTIQLIHDPAKTYVALERFVAKYNAGGGIEWVRRVPFRPGGMAANNVGCYFTGIFYDTVSFNSLTFTSNGLEDVLFGLFNGVGDLVWAKAFGGIGRDMGDDIAVNQNKEVLMASTFSDKIVVDSDTLTSSGRSGLLIRCDSLGNILTKGYTNGAGAVKNLKIKTDNFGNTYAAAYAMGAVVAGQQTYNAFSQNDLFMMKWDATGQVVWVDMVRGANRMNIADIALARGNQELYIAGDFQNTMIIGNNTITNGGSNNTIFLAKLDQIHLTSTSSFISEQNYAVYPNPASKNLHLELPEGILTAIVEITDLSGRLVLKSYFTADTKMLDIAAVPSGMYVLRITTSVGSVAKKLRVEN